MKKLFIQFLIPVAMIGGAAWAGDKKPKPPKEPTQAQKIEIMQQEILALRAELNHVHNEDLVQVQQWLQYFYEQLGHDGVKMEQRDKSEDRF
jgi:hypothetical protein